MENVGFLDQPDVIVNYGVDKQIPFVTASFTDTAAFPPIHSLDFDSLDRFDEEDMDTYSSDDNVSAVVSVGNGGGGGNDGDGDADSGDDDESAGLCASDIQEMHNNEEPPLYVTTTDSQLIPSPITVQEHVCAVGAFAARHNLSDIAFRDLLSLVQLHIPKNNIGETKVLRLKEKCGFNKTYLNFHLYCEACNKLYTKESDTCLTPGCTGSKLSGNSVKYFTTSNLGSQLQEVLQREKLWEMTRNHMKVEHKNICDIQGGMAYREFLKPGNFLHNSNNITFSAFTDGVALFKSSGVQLWPVYLLINEIPPKERFHRKNMLLWGIWQGKGKPRMNMFLRPLIQDLLKLYHEGADIMIQNKKINVKALLVVATMDLPARAYATNMTQYNGKFSCLYCEEEGTVVKSGAGTCRAFLSREEPAKLRTKDSINDCSVKALRNNERMMGFLGVSVLSYLPHFSLNSNIQIDYMHGILLGITKKLLDQWFDAKSSKEEDFYIGDKTAEVDQRLAGIQPPYIIHRTPRSIGNTLKNWKASEFRNWLLFYAIPCLINILPDVYLKHFSLLVEATYLLLSTGITAADLNKANILLHAFLKNAQLLYGQNFMGLNVHNLVHLVAMVKMWGPLWAWSCFPFESFNGELKKTIHGTGNVCRQIFWSFQAEKRILFQSSKINRESGTRKYIDQLFDSQDGSSCTEAYMCQIFQPKCRILQALSAEEKRQLKTILPTSKAEDNFVRLFKVMRNGFVFSAKKNLKVSKQNSYTFLLDPRVQQRQDVFAFEAETFLLHELSMRVVCKGRFLKCVGKVPGMSTTHIHLVEYR